MLISIPNTQIIAFINATRHMCFEVLPFIRFYFVERITRLVIDIDKLRKLKFRSKLIKIIVAEFSYLL